MVDDVLGDLAGGQTFPDASAGRDDVRLGTAISASEERVEFPEAGREDFALAVEGRAELPEEDVGGLLLGDHLARADVGRHDDLVGRGTEPLEKLGRSEFRVAGVLDEHAHLGHIEPLDPVRPDTLRVRARLLLGRARGVLHETLETVHAAGGTVLPLRDELRMDADGIVLLLGEVAGHDGLPDEARGVDGERLTVGQEIHDDVAAERVRCVAAVPE